MDHMRTAQVSSAKIVLRIVCLLLLRIFDIYSWSKQCFFSCYMLLSMYLCNEGMDSYIHAVEIGAVFIFWKYIFMSEEFASECCQRTTKSLWEKTQYTWTEMLGLKYCVWFTYRVINVLGWKFWLKHLFFHSPLWCTINISILRENSVLQAIALWT